MRTYQIEYILFTCRTSAIESHPFGKLISLYRITLPIISFYIMMSVFIKIRAISFFSLYVDVEVQSAIGRADVVLKLSDAIYVFEFKFDGTPDEALAQIESKNYAIPYQSDGRRIVKIGVNFDNATRTIGEWKIVD